MLTDEERRKIYEEEKARAEAQEGLKQKTNGKGLSVASLVLGILAIFPFSLLTGIPAIVTGHVAVGQKRPGKGMAVAGLLMGWVSLVPVIIVAAVMLARRPNLAGSNAQGQSSGLLSRNEAPGPKITDFEILNWRIVSREYGSPEVVGEVRNNGTLPAGVQLQAIARAANGDVVGSDDFWPASISNIPPGRTWPISFPLSSEGKFSKVELRVIGVCDWENH